MPFTKAINYFIRSNKNKSLVSLFQETKMGWLLLFRFPFLSWKSSSSSKMQKVHIQRERRWLKETKRTGRERERGREQKTFGLKVEMGNTINLTFKQ